MSLIAPARREIDADDLLDEIDQLWDLLGSTNPGITASEIRAIAVARLTAGVAS